MNDVFQSYLQAHPPHHETIETWPIQGDLRVRFCLGSTLPPAEVVSSILAIVFDAHQRVLFLFPEQFTGSINHVLIGGRSEPGETHEQTAIREVGEETGWRIQPFRMIGFRHFFHLKPRAEKTDRPYPHFIQPIFAARALDFDSSLMIEDDYSPVEFLDFSDAEQAIDPEQRPLLLAAVKALPG